MTDEPVFAIQVLIRCVSEIPGRAQAHLRSVIGVFDIFRGDNYSRLAGLRLALRRGHGAGAPTPDRIGEAAAGIAGDDRYWTDSFPKLAPDATTVVTNIINRLRTSPPLSAFLGSSVTTYDVRRAMDTGRMVFVCTTGTGETNKLITSLMIYDLFRAGRSRADTSVEKRRRCDAFVDELAAILEQLRKYQVALHAMNQMPNRLPITGPRPSGGRHWYGAPTAGST